MTLLTEKSCVSAPTPIYRTVVLAIQGVGNPRRGEIAQALAKNLDAGSVESEVTEINWNTVADQPINPKGNLVPSSLKSLISDLATTIAYHFSPPYLS
jgi:hypothetical protein